MLQFIDDLKKLVLFGGFTLVLEEKIVPGISTAQADHKILFGQSKRTERIDQQCDQFRVGRHVLLPENVGI